MEWKFKDRRDVSRPGGTVLSTLAYAPFGETYASSGTPDKSFTAQNSDTTPGDYDFLYRQYSNQGRWASPDRAGLSAAQAEETIGAMVAGGQLSSAVGAIATNLVTGTAPLAARPHLMSLERG